MPFRHTIQFRRVPGSAGFTAIELIAAVVVILILVGVILAVFGDSRGEAVALRRNNAASILNEAEHSLAEYNSSTGPGLGRNPVTIIGTDPAARILALQQAGFLNSLVKPSDVILNSTGTCLWTPAP
jgi:type II secretory pathway pseudopilin PulG